MIRPRLRGRQARRGKRRGVKRHGGNTQDPPADANSFNGAGAPPQTVVPPVGHAAAAAPAAVAAAPAAVAAAAIPAAAAPQPSPTAAPAAAVLPIVAAAAGQPLAPAQSAAPVVQTVPPEAGSSVEPEAVGRDDVGPAGAVEATAPAEGLDESGRNVRGGGRRGGKGRGRRASAGPATNFYALE
eukprot:scaffold9366_cov118-Isochrysis_galbana.AAC.2